MHVESLCCPRIKFWQAHTYFYSSPTVTGDGALERELDSVYYIAQVYGLVSPFESPIPTLSFILHIREKASARE